MKLRKTTATLLIAILMISALSVMSIGAPANGYTEAVLEAADRLVQMQNDDGGFMWRVEEPGDSALNTLGITAMGILKAHELLDKPDYETALAKAYGFAYTTPDCKRFPDITFLIGLAGACSDSSLLAAVDAEVTETTVQSILDLAKERWDTRLSDLGGGDPVVMAEYLLSGIRPGQLAFWDLEAAVKAALALDPHFDTGYKAQALAIAGVMYENLEVGSDYYFDITDTSTVCYTLALSGAIEGFSELGIYPTITRTMTSLLIDYQDVADHWDESDSGDTVSVQSTAYAVMALISQGDADALVAAREGGDWLVSTQDELGGWDPCYFGGTENLEVDSEAAWALSGLVKPTHEYICVWWLEDAERYNGDGTFHSSWTDDPIPPATPVGYVEFKVTGRAYHGNMEWFYNYWPLEDFEASPLVIANGKFAAWSRYTSPRSDLSILDKIRGKLTISGGTARGSYVQYSYAFGGEEVPNWYPGAVETDESGMWHIGTTYYTVHGQE